VHLRFFVAAIRLLAESLSGKRIAVQIHEMPGGERDFIQIGDRWPVPCCTDSMFVAEGYASDFEWIATLHDLKQTAFSFPADDVVH
jgi:hypothetical protein